MKCKLLVKLVTPIRHKYGMKTGINVLKSFKHVRFLFLCASYAIGEFSESLYLYTVLRMPCWVI